MKVELINYTPDALDLLLSTKNTRLSFKSDPAEWTHEEKMESLSYMKDTIKSSWEFVDYTFKIEGVTRSFTHQFVRTRTASFAQESLRVVDARDHEVMVPENMSGLAKELWENTTDDVLDTYGTLLDAGVGIQDARGILPINTTTSIIAKFNLRTLHDTAQTRLCVRTQGEYQNVFRAMRSEVMKVHPWAEDFIQVACVQNGTCAFPRYGRERCPVYHPNMDLTTTKAVAKIQFWGLRHEADPTGVKR